MAGKTYDLTPRKVPRVETRFRRIVTAFPAPGSLPVIQKLRRLEPRSMEGMPPVVWDRAEGFQVYDASGNMWLDWSSGVLVANAGHGRAEIVDAIVRQAKKGLLHNYVFASELRATLVGKLLGLAPPRIDKCFLVTTGAETTECAIKLARTYGRQRGGGKIGIVTFDGAFHGRTLGAQQAGGIPSLKEWIVNLDQDFHQVPFPGDFRCEDRGFGVFLDTLDAKGLDGSRIAGVMTETYQGGGASFMPAGYAQRLAQWCKANDVLLIFDEVQAGFGRTGRMFAFEHLDVTPDVICCGKGISSSLPIACVMGRHEVMDIYGPAEMTSTHSGNPICAAAAIANIDILVNENLPGNAAAVGEVLLRGLSELQRRHPEVLGAVHGRGLVAGVHVVKPGGKDPDRDLAHDIVERCVEKGLLMFAPVGPATIKICPPLCITAEAVDEGVAVLGEAVVEILSARQ